MLWEMWWAWALCPVGGRISPGNYSSMSAQGVQIRGLQSWLGWVSHLMFWCPWRSLLGVLLGPSCNDCRSPPFWGQAENTQSELRLLWHPAFCCFHLCCSHSATLKDSSAVSKGQSYSLTALGLFSLPQVQVPFMLSLNWPVILWFIGLKAGWWYRNDES